MSSEHSENDMVYEVVINHEEQYSIWPEYKGDPPPGWRKAGKKGLKSECLSYVKEVWTDMRPLSLRKKMKEIEELRPELEKEEAKRIEEAKEKAKDPRDDLVKYLSENDHPVEAGVRPERTMQCFKDAIDRGYVHVKFTDTRGGTELGIRLDEKLSDFSQADFEKETGSVHLEGDLTLNYVKVRCIADISLKTLEGQGHLERLTD
jgi:uncharacterized protein YbdZ (MbtH family)